MDKAQKECFLREQLKAIRKELGDGVDADEELEDITKAIEKAGLPPMCARRRSNNSSASPPCTAIPPKPACVAHLSRLAGRTAVEKDLQGQLDINKAKAVLDEVRLRA